MATRGGIACVGRARSKARTGADLAGDRSPHRRTRRFRDFARGRSRGLCRNAIGFPGPHVAPHRPCGTSPAGHAMNSPCCSAPTTFVVDNPRLRVGVCPTCGTLWGEHARAADGRPWYASYIPPAFAAALHARRVRQADAIATLLTRAGAAAPVLDYGTGQGVFLRALLRRGVDAYGCDLDLDAPHNDTPRERLLPVAAPWAVPHGEWRTIVLLDVLEHHPDPVAFLATLPAAHVLLKLPNATGPAARLARLAARRGRPGLLEQLFLVGENFPHRWLATAAGVRAIAARAGFTIAAARNLTEVGWELPQRMRGAGRGLLRTALLRAAGAALGAIGPLWSDASVVLLRRVAPVARATPAPTASAAG